MSRDLRNFRIVLPKCATRRRTRRMRNCRTMDEVKHTVDRNRLTHAVACRQLNQPRQLQAADIRVVDLSERAEMLLAEGAPIAGPIATATTVQQARCTCVIALPPTHCGNEERHRAKHRYGSFSLHFLHG